MLTSNMQMLLIKYEGIRKMTFTHMCILSQPDTLSCGSGRPSWCGSEGGCMVGSPGHSQPVPFPSSGTCVRAVTRPVAAESAFAFLGLVLDHWNQGGSEETVVAAVDQMKH